MPTADFLLEIGTEEIPAGYLPGAVAELARRVEATLDDAGVAHGEVVSFATPRRLAVRVADVAPEQATRTEHRLGPAVAAAFDGDGNPTKAAEGFARSVGTTVDQLQREDTDKGERLAFDATVGGTPTVQLLTAAGVLEGWLQLGFPKTMRWIPGSDLSFARPIRWLVALLGDEVLPLTLGHLSAGRTSRGHRTLGPDRVEFSAPRQYESGLREAGVLVDPEERRQLIHTEAMRLAAEAGGRLHEAPDLLEELTYLSEHPTGVLGGFDSELTDILPREVVIAAMRSHQRYFSVENDDGSLRPHFITFRDGGERGRDNVVEGNQRVLRARLDDARFYWDEDRALDSDAKLARLDRVVWLEGFGSIGDKCRRIANLAGQLADHLKLEVDRQHLQRAALLCKSDLATEMIKDGKEFTKLQGTIGRYYALEAGEDSAVADAIAEHLHPKVAADRLPSGDLARTIALADRLDSIAGCALAGFAPSGSQDPYALRRQAFAVLRLLVETPWRLSLLDWVDTALAGFDGGDPEAARCAIGDLFWGRLETQLSDLPVEVVRGVLSVSTLDPVDNTRAARALAQFQTEESFRMLLEGAKRCRNILVKEERLAEETLPDQERAAALQAESTRRWGAWSQHVKGEMGLSFAPDRFQEEAERALHAAVLESVPTLAEATAQDAHGDVYRSLANLGASVSRYFDEVLVNAEDPEVRENRLRFLENIHYLFANFADLSRIPADS